VGDCHGWLTGAFSGWTVCFMNYGQHHQNLVPLCPVVDFTFLRHAPCRNQTGSNAMS
jgi:hypothetical protein